jgi:NTE family protein
VRGFVLSGGGTHAATQTGMLRALLEHGVEPDLVVGTSAGALNSAFFARRPTLARVERLKQLWLEAPARQIFPVRPRALVLGISGRRDYLVPNEGLRRWIVDCLDFTLIEETAIPLHIVATNLLVGTPVVLSDGPVTPALMASTAIPGVFAPITIGGQLLIDGGVAADVPVAEAADLGATDIWVLPAAGVGADRPPKGALAVLLRAVAARARHLHLRPAPQRRAHRTGLHRGVTLAGRRRAGRAGHRRRPRSRLTGPARRLAPRVTDHQAGTAWSTGRTPPTMSGTHRRRHGLWPGSVTRWAR